MGQWYRREDLKRDTKHPLMQPQNNFIRTSYIKIKRIQQNSKCILCNDIDKIATHMCKCNRPDQKQYKTKQND